MKSSSISSSWSFTDQIFTHHHLTERSHIQALPDNRNSSRLKRLLGSSGLNSAMQCFTSEKYAKAVGQVLPSVAFMCEVHSQRPAVFNLFIKETMVDAAVELANEEELSDLGHADHFVSQSESVAHVRCELRRLFRGSAKFGICLASSSCKLLSKTNVSRIELDARPRATDHCRLSHLPRYPRDEG